MNHLTSYIPSPAGRIHNFAFYLFTFQTDQSVSLGQLCKTKPIYGELVEPIYWMPKMNLTVAPAKDYENKWNWTPGEIKPNLVRRPVLRSPKGEGGSLSEGGFKGSGLHRIQFDKGYGQKYENRQPCPQLRPYRTENNLCRQQLAHEIHYQAQARQCKTNHNRRLHHLRVTADQNRKANHQHYKIDDRVGNPEMLLTVKLRQILDLLIFFGLLSQSRKLQSLFWSGSRLSNHLPV